MLDSTRFSWTGAALVLLGCGADAPSNDRRLRDGGSDAAVHDAGPASHDGGAADAASDPTDAGSNLAALPNDSFETARPITLDAPGGLHDVTQAGQVDYYSFEAEAGAFYALSTDQGTFAPDTVVALFNPDRQLLGENDNGSIWPGDQVDSRLVVRVAQAGTHFVRVQNHLTSGSVFPPVFYHLAVQHLAPDTAGVALQGTQGVAQVHFAHDKASGYAYATLCGDFADVEAGMFEFAGQADQVLVGHVLPEGARENGSTARIGLVRVLGDDGALSSIDGTKGQRSFHPPVGDATYQLSVMPDGDPGPNAFFAIDLVMLPDNPREQAEDDNDTLEGAEDIQFEQEMFRRRGLLLASLAHTDVDYYRFDEMSAATVTVVCEGESGGSGVHGLHAELRDSDDATLVAADESFDSNLVINAFQVPEMGTYYLRLSSDTLAKDVSEPWARCLLITQP
jgi:hypothetical protein